MIKVLFVTSNYALERMVAVTLTINGLAVSSVSHLSDGTALLEKNNFNIILLDNDFSDVWSVIRDKGFTTPILILGDAQNLDTSVDVDYLLKPFDFLQLKTKMNQIFRRPKSFEEKIITAGDMVIDVSAQMVLIKDKILSLGRMEMAILVSLARKTGKIVSRERMRMDLEAQGHFFNTTIFPHIKNLKRKLKDVAGEKLQIKLVIGEGYQLMTN